MDKMKKDKINLRRDRIIRGRFNNSILKAILLSIIFLTIFLLQITNISAIGITPGRTTLNFEPGLSREVQFSIVNTEHKDMSVVFYVQGELNNSITLTQALATFSASEESKSFSYKVNLPQKFRSLDYILPKLWL